MRRIRDWVSVSVVLMAASCAIVPATTSPTPAVSERPHVSAAYSLVPSAISSPQPSSTPAPTFDAPPPGWDGPPTASATRRGFQLDLWVDRSSVRIGERINAFVRVTNKGDEAPPWETNTCESGPAPVTAHVEDALPPGENWQGNADAFKKQVLDESGVTVGGSSAVGYFAIPQPEGRPVGCTLRSVVRPFQPNQVEEATLAWHVVPPPGLVIPNGEMTLVARFDAMGLSASTNVVVAGADAPPVTIVDYIDAALSVAEFREWLEAQRQATWVNTAVFHWPTPDGEMPPREPYKSAPNGAVDIGLFTSPPGTNGQGKVILDPVTLDVLGTRFE